MLDALSVVVPTGRAYDNLRSAVAKRDRDVVTAPSATVSSPLMNPRVAARAP
jgi:hypothetical protein